MGEVRTGGGATAPTQNPDVAGVVSNARLIAELQAVTLAITMFGLDRLPEVMGVGQDNDPPLDVIDSPYDDCDPEPDDEEDDLADCGLFDGQCALAGTEWCDWSCPLGGLNLRQAARTQASL